MSVINQEQTNNLLIILPPSLPNLSGFPHRGRSTARSFSPLGETGKGVFNTRWKWLNKNQLMVIQISFLMNAFIQIIQNQDMI